MIKCFFKYSHISHKQGFVRLCSASKFTQELKVDHDLFK